MNNPARILEIAKMSCEISDGKSDLDLWVTHEFEITRQVELLDIKTAQNVLEHLKNYYTSYLTENAQTLMKAEYERNQQNIPQKRIWEQGDCFWNVPDYAAMECVETPKFRTFFNIVEVINSRIDKLSPKLHSLKDFFIKDHDRCIAIINRELEMCKKPQGKLIATMIIAFSELGYLIDISDKKAQLYDILKHDYPNKIGSPQSINKYLRAYYEPNSENNQVRLSKKKIEEMKRKIEDFSCM